MRVVSFIIDESHLRQLSAEARSELLQIIGAELADLKSALADRDWDPEGNKSYPLSADEARVLIRGLGQPAKNLLRTFCLNYDGKVGSSELDFATGSRLGVLQRIEDCRRQDLAPNDPQIRACYVIAARAPAPACCRNDPRWSAWCGR